MSLTTIRAGKAVLIPFSFSTMSNVYSRQLPYAPPSPPTITIFDPGGVKQVNAQPMIQQLDDSGVPIVGAYQYVYPTPAAGPLGIWSAWVDVVDASGLSSGSVDAPDQQKATPVFTLV